jgi:hypothetical protein
MPFADELKSGYEDVIKPAIWKAEMKYVRADQDPHGQYVNYDVGPDFRFSCINSRFFWC